jgi:hypothetical protein
VKGRTQTNFYLQREEHKQWLLPVKGRRQTMTFTCEGKNTDELFLPVKGRTRRTYYYHMFYWL